MLLMEEIFNKIDTDSSGFIEWKELENFMISFAESMGQPKPKKKQIE